MSFVIFEHSLIGEGQRVTVKAKFLRSHSRAQEAENKQQNEPAKTHTYAPLAHNHIKNARTRWSLCLRRKRQASGISGSVSPVVHLSQCSRSAANCAAARYRHFPRPHRNRGARRLPVQEQFHQRLRASTNPERSV